MKPFTIADEICSTLLNYLTIICSFLDEWVDVSHRS